MDIYYDAKVTNEKCFSLHGLAADLRIICDPEGYDIEPEKLLAMVNLIEDQEAKINQYMLDEEIARKLAFLYKLPCGATRSGYVTAYAGCGDQWCKGCNSFQGLADENYKEMSRLVSERKVEVQRELELSSISNCPRCNGDHVRLMAKKYKIPVGTYTHWATCPESGDPVNVEVLKPVGA